METIETHWSWLFLTATSVLKLKKPLKRPWIDLTTIEARAANCLDEVRLNRRLTKGVYRGVVPLRIGDDGSLAIGGEGQTVDWLVEMARLPSESMLDLRLVKGCVTGDDVTSVATRLADFYAGQSPRIADGHLYLEHLRREMVENRRLLGTADLGVERAATTSVLDAVDRLLPAVRPLIEARIAEGRIIEGHGDLRPEHVCLLRPVQIFDCLEFDRGMRIIDPFDEVNYLGLEGIRLGAGWIRPHLLSVLDEMIGGHPPPLLMTFYSAFRATLRARICLAHLEDDEPMTPDRWPHEARAWLTLAQGELRRNGPV